MKMLFHSRLYFFRIGCAVLFASMLTVSQSLGAAAGTATAKAADAPVMLTRAEVVAYLAVQQKMSKNPRIAIATLDVVNDNKPKARYTADEITSFVADANKSVKRETVVEAQKKNYYLGPHTFPWLRLRRSYTDVLTFEDPSLAEGSEESFDDIKGALFSYERDLRNHTDTWSAQAALMAPFSFYTGYEPVKGDGLGIQRWGFIPSVSLDRLTTSGDASKEIEQWTYRMGLFARMKSGNPLLLALSTRAYASYVRDDLKDRSVTAGEFEIEPMSRFSKLVKIGARTIIIPKKNEKDPEDSAYLAYQFRLLLHGEFGSVNSEGPAFTGKEYTFFRLGPVAQLDFKPFIFKNLSIGLKYSYLPALTGQNPNDTLLTADAEWILHEDKEALRRLSFKVSYVNGGLDLTKEKTHTLLIGLGAAF